MSGEQKIDGLPLGGVAFDQASGVDYTVVSVGHRGGKVAAAHAWAAKEGERVLIGPSRRLSPIAQLGTTIHERIELAVRGERLSEPAEEPSR